ncbi:MAG: signal peptidase II [Clostridia bacterium]|nr:signal peptidase II [Clostridia bacterium]
MLKRNKLVAQPALKLAVSAIVIAVIIAADILLKRFTVEKIQGTDGIVLIPGVIKLTYATNDGAAWSMLKGEQEFFIILTVAVLMVVGYILVRGYVKGWFGVISLVACIGGTIGNFIDRVKQGYVVDMFETLFVEFPIFNIADIFLTLGCIALGVYVLFLHDRAAAAERLPSKSGFAVSFSGEKGYIAENGKVSAFKAKDDDAEL